MQCILSALGVGKDAITVFLIQLAVSEIACNYVDNLRNAHKICLKIQDATEDFLLESREKFGGPNQCFHVGCEMSLQGGVGACPGALVQIALEGSIIEPVLDFENNKKAHDHVVEQDIIHTFRIEQADGMIKDN